MDAVLLLHVFILRFALVFDQLLISASSLSKQQAEGVLAVMQCTNFGAPPFHSSVG
jgi:hypothetical protein